jgi:hypothetical protein
LKIKNLHAKKERNIMKSNIQLMAVAAAICLIFAAGVTASEVSQGKCLAYDQDGKIIRIEEYDTNFDADAPYGKSTGIVSEYDCAAAKIGIHPEPGDVLRIAYTDDGAVKKAVKVMNVSKQDLRKK